MIINFEKIKELLKNENLKEVSRQTGIPYRTLQNWKLGSNTWLKDVEDRLYKLNDYIKKKEDEWSGEDYTDHLHPAYLPAWKELQDKVVEAYENI